MSTFTGTQGKGAMAAHRAHKRIRAENRNSTAVAKWWPCGHKHGAVVCDVPENDRQDTPR